MKGYVSLALIALPAIPLGLLVWKVTNGNFTYSLDDPYIHLALARNIWSGSYGINPLEHSAPASSVIWPFILAPFSALPLKGFEFVPLIINVICALLSGYLLMALFEELRGIQKLIIAVAIMVSFNAYGLLFTGMEHSLQIGLVIAVVYGFVNRKRVESDLLLKLFYYLCLIMLPLVRYEGLAISIPILTLLFIKDGQKLAVASMFIILVTLVLFSLYINSLGLGYLPSSVIAKSSYTGFRTIVDNMMSNLHLYGWLLALICVYCMHNWKRDRVSVMAMASITALHFMFGKNGWYGRYEVYYVLFVFLLMAKSILRSNPGTWLYFCVTPLAFPGLVYATLTTPLAASNVYQQQAQMADIARLLNERIAVHDLGLVALRGNNYVLDLWGLGSIEALKLRKSESKDPGWISRLMREKAVNYAFVYDSWFPVRPGDWIKVAELKLNGKQITANYDTVSLYAVSTAGVEKLRGVLEDYKTLNPAGNITIRIQD